MLTASKHSVKSCVIMTDTGNLNSSVLLAELEHFDLLLWYTITFYKLLRLCSVV